MRWIFFVDVGNHILVLYIELYISANSMKNIVEESAFSITELRSCFTYTEKVNKDVIPILSNVPVAIIHLEGEDNSYDGREGEITYIDAIGQLHGTWGGLAIIPEADEFELIG